MRKVFNKKKQEKKKPCAIDKDDSGMASAEELFELAKSGVETVESLKKRIENMEKWFEEEIKRRDAILDNVHREKQMLFNSAVSEANKSGEMKIIIERYKKKVIALEEALSEKESPKKRAIRKEI
ncbi:MAG: hypothetical protein NTV63_04715 [Candidatus Woesearchaeota archaeon]|nr:hypothetical protein [Candidatus Woesearchaeota archaeon]